jgi:hypothetical protein
MCGLDDEIPFGEPTEGYGDAWFAKLPFLASVKAFR